MSRNQYDGIDEYAVKLIGHKASQLVGKYGFTKTDREDLEQEIALALLLALPKYDSERGQRSTFISRVVDHSISDMIEARKAAKRDYRLCTSSLDDRLVKDENDATELIDTVDQDDYLIRTGSQSRSAAELQDLRLDVERLINKLPDDLRELCLQLKSANVSQVSSDTGTSRSTIYRKLKILRVIAEAFGLGDYLNHQRYSLREFPVHNKWRPESRADRETDTPVESSERIEESGGSQMNGSVVKYSFDTALSMKDVEESLMLAVMATECLHNRSAVMLDACFNLDTKEHSCVVDTTTAVGRDIAVLFTGLLRREFGESVFRVKRVEGSPRNISQPTSKTERKPTNNLGGADGK